MTAFTSTCVSLQPIVVNQPSELNPELNKILFSLRTSLLTREESRFLQIAKALQTLTAHPIGFSADSISRMVIIKHRMKRASLKCAAMARRR